MEPQPREAVPAEVPSVGEEEWERLGRREIPDPDDETIRQLHEDLALDSGNPFLRCAFFAALERIGQHEAAIGQLRELWRRLAEALAMDATDVEAVLAVAYAVE